MAIWLVNMADAERNLRTGTKAKRSNRPDVNYVERNAKNMSKKSEMIVEPKGNDPKTDADVNLTKIRFVNEDAITLKATIITIDRKRKCGKRIRRAE